MRIPHIPGGAGCRPEPDRTPRLQVLHIPGRGVLAALRCGRPRARRSCGSRSAAPAWPLPWPRRSSRRRRSPGRAPAGPPPLPRPETPFWLPLPSPSAAPWLSSCGIVLNTITMMPGERLFAKNTVSTMPVERLFASQCIQQQSATWMQIIRAGGSPRWRLVVRGHSM